MSDVQSINHPLKLLAVGTFVQFAAPVVILAVIGVVISVVSSLPGTPDIGDKILNETFSLFGYNWFILGAALFLTGPLFSIGTMYVLNGRRRTLLMLFPLSFYVLYALPLLFGGSFPPLYDLPKPYVQGSERLAKKLTAGAEIPEIQNTAVIVQDGVVYQIEDGMVFILTDHSFTFDFSKPLEIGNDSHTLVTNDQSGSIVVDLLKQTKVKSVYNITDLATSKPEAIARKDNLLTLLNIYDFSQRDIPSSTSSAYIQNARYLPGESQVLVDFYKVFEEKTYPQRVFEIVDLQTSQVTFLDNEDLQALFSQLQYNQHFVMDPNNNVMYMYGRLEDGGIVRQGIWRIDPDRQTAELLYTSSDGAGIRAFSLDSSGEKLAAITMQFASDQGNVVIIDLVARDEIAIPASDLLFHAPTIHSEQQFVDIGWIAEDTIWITARHRSQQYPRRLDETKRYYDIWLVKDNGKFLKTVATDVDNYAFSDKFTE